MTALSFEQKAVRVFKLIALTFSLLSILELVLLRHLDFMGDYLGDKKEIVSVFKHDNFLFLIGVSNKISNNERHSSLNYLLIPNQIALPTILSVYENTNGNVSYENENTLEAILAIFLLVYGYYLIGCHLKEKITRKVKILL